MQAVLISSKDKTKSREDAEKIFRELKINKFDIIFFEFEKAVGIPDIREIQKKIYLKPFKSEVKAIVIDANPGITIEAQNALLKTLEEAPEDTIIVLLCQNSLDLLPTIISRCKVIELKGDIEQDSSISEYLNILISNRAGDKLKFAQDLAKDKDEAINFLESSILFLRNKLLKEHYNNIYHYSEQIRFFQKYHTIIKGTNVNLRLALENLFLNL